MATVTRATSEIFSSQSKVSPFTDKQIQDAKDAVMTFFEGENFEKLVGHRSTLKDALVIIFKDAKERENIAFGTGLGRIFSTLIEHAVEAEMLDESVDKLFFDDQFDQVSFVADLAKQMIASVEASEAVHGEPVPPSAEDGRKSSEELLGFFRSDRFNGSAVTKEDDFVELGSVAAFRKTLIDIQARSKDAFEAFCLDDNESPGYVKLFSDLIRDAVDNKLINEQVGTVFFNPNFDQLRFIESVIAALSVQVID